VVTIDLPKSPRNPALTISLPAGRHERSWNRRGTVTFTGQGLLQCRMESRPAVTRLEFTATIHAEGTVH